MKLARAQAAGQPRRLQPDPVPRHRPRYWCGAASPPSPGSTPDLSSSHSYPAARPLSRSLVGALIFHGILAAALGKIAVPVARPPERVVTTVLPMEFLLAAEPVADTEPAPAGAEDTEAALIPASLPSAPLPPPPAAPETAWTEHELPEIADLAPAPVIAVEIAQPTGPDLAWVVPLNQWPTNATAEALAAAPVHGQGTATTVAAVAPAPPSPTGVGTGAGYRLPAYWRNPRPVYPEIARQNRWEGTTLLRVEVLPTGSAGQILVATSSGYDILDDASVRTVQRWRFHPARRGREAVACWVEVPINFQMQGN